MSVTARSDPFTGFSFELKLEGLVVGGFSEVSGLAAEIDIEEYREGGSNDFVHRLPKVTKYGNLVLKRGITESNELYKWYKDVVRGIIQRRTVTVNLLDTQKRILKVWNFKNAFPVKWNASDLKSDGNTILVESVELVHQGLIWV